ncbi:MAG: hydrogenase 4 subunit B [Burkholderiaceae bacterium]|nr:hydrogenase 4 subunit B [Burkholderiaceae bacterium]
MNWGTLDCVLWIISGWLVIGACGALAVKRSSVVAHILYPVGAVLGMLLSAIGLLSVFGETQTGIVSVGLPNLPFHLRLDSLSSYFLLVLGIVSTGVSFYSVGYFRKEEETPLGIICLEYHVCIASMAMILIADDAYAFMVAWETMSLSATFLVTANHSNPEVRYAGFLYFLISHIGALGLLLCFGLLQADTGNYTFSNMREQHLDLLWASAAFFLAFFGFGAKAGILPLHIWLPEAHPAAPSPISALMSAFVLKTGVYGFIRVTFDLLQMQVWWWGAIVLAVGLATAMFGVVLSATQTDMKRLLAYSSIENIGLMFTGIGLTIIFHAYEMNGMAALSLTATLYHVASHASFKSLLFLGTGAVVHATGERNLGKLGGLMRFMPWAAWAALIGVLAAAGLPPLGGFVSEWLLLQSFLLTPGLPNSILNMLVPIVAGVIVLVGAMAAYVMVKFFGVIFLGQPREQKLHHAHDVNTWERIGFGWLVAACLTLGFFPVQMTFVIDRVTDFLVSDGIGTTVAQNGLLLIAPVAAERASYMPVAFVMVLLICCLLAFVLVRFLYHGRIRRSVPWACGYPFQTAKMQDTAEGLGQPVRHIYGNFFHTTDALPSAFDKQPRFRITVEDRFWGLLYRPVVFATKYVSNAIGILQHGRISIYLLYSLATLMLLLLLVTQ